jgi:preprotein translocase subunit Sec63
MSEERLKRLEKHRGEMLEARSARKNLFMLRIARVAVGILLISLLLVNIYTGILGLE